MCVPIVNFSMDIQLRAFWRSMQVIDKWLTGRVLLTGATGFLGVFILKDLLENTKVCWGIPLLLWYGLYMR